MSTPVLSPAPPAAPNKVSGSRLADLVVPEVRWAALALGLFALGGVLELLGAPAALWWAAYLLCYLAGGWEPAWAGLQALTERRLDVDLLMILAAIVAAAIGQVLDGALLIVIFASSGALEAVATRRTRESVRALLDLAPEVASRVDEFGAESTVEATSLQIGDVIRVRPGERIGADGVVIEGLSDVDQASITGESAPAVKQPGSEVFAGTMNGIGALLVQVSRRAEDSVVARIVSLVAQASETKAKAQLFVENIEQKYSIGMVAATIGLFVIPLSLGSALQPTLLRAITFMIVASPCAVVLATMPPLLSAIANCGRHGVLVKSAVVMEQLGQTDQVAFDKTGTLTMGRPHVVAVDRHPEARMSEAEILQYAAAAELDSQHPLAAAIVDAADAANAPLPRATDFTSTPGHGVQAVVAGAVVEVTAAAQDVDPAEPFSMLLGQREAAGHTVVVVRIDRRIEAAISLIDQQRTDAASAVRELAVITKSNPILLTGDNQSAAERLAAAVGIADVRAGLLPEDKVDAVRSLQRAGRRVCLIGDGVNDAPAMAVAHLGVAMGRHGSDLALETADAVIVNDELTAVGRAISLSRRARRVVLANLAIAAAVITGLVVWDLVGTLPLPLGVAGHEGSTVIVGLNGLRLLRKAAWHRQ